MCLLSNYCQLKKSNTFSILECHCQLNSYVQFTVIKNGEALEVKNSHTQTIIQCVFKKLRLSVSVYKNCRFKIKQRVNTDGQTCNKHDTETADMILSTSVLCSTRSTIELEYLASQIHPQQRQPAQTITSYC